MLLRGRLSGSQREFLSKLTTDCRFGRSRFLDISRSSNKIHKIQIFRGNGYPQCLLRAGMVVTPVVLPT